MAHDEGLERQAEARERIEAAQPVNAAPEFQETTEGIIPQVARMNEEDRGRTPRNLRTREVDPRTGTATEWRPLTNPPPTRRRNTRQMGGPIPPEVRAELDRMQDATLRREAIRPETPREQIDRLVREQRAATPPRPPATWWDEPVNPQPVNVAAGHRHVINVVDDDWDAVLTMETPELARELRRGNHGARIEHGDMKDVAPKQPEPPDIMGKPEDHFL